MSKENYHQHKYQYFRLNYRAGDTGVGGVGGVGVSVVKRKKGDKEKKERVSKQKLLKGCHQGQNIIVLTILERLEFEKFFLSANHGGRQYFPVFHGTPTLKSISPALNYQEKIVKKSYQ